MHTLDKITVESFERFQGEIMIETDGGKQFSVDEIDFEKWLRRNDKLDYSLPSFDGEHESIEGTASMNEYWNFQSKYHNGDLAEYIESK